MRHGRSAGITKFSDSGVDGGKKNDQCLREEAYAVKRTGKPLSNREGFCSWSCLLACGWHDFWFCGQSVSQSTIGRSLPVNRPTPMPAARRQWAPPNTTMRLVLPSQSVELCSNRVPDLMGEQMAIGAGIALTTHNSSCTFAQSAS